MNIIKTAAFSSAFAVASLFAVATPLAVLANSPVNPAPISLGSAGDFVVLSKAGISTTGATKVTGNMGVSPVAASYITGFSLILPSAGAFSTSALVTGNIYAPDYASPTASGLTTAVLDMQTAYADGAGRTPDVTELGAGNIGGLTIAPGVYKWGSSLSIPTDITLSGSAQDVWIFQVAQTLSLSNGAKINLVGGARAANVFWVVAGQTTVGTTAVFSGNVLDKTGIVLNTGAVLNGRALAQTSVTLDANAVTVPAGAITIAAVPVVAVLTPMPPEKQFFLNVISPNGGEIWKIGEEKSVQVNILGAPALSYLQMSLVNGPTPIDIKGQLNPSGNISFNYTLPKSGCRTDMCFDVKAGSYKLEAVLYDKQPCNMRADCVPEKRLASDLSDASFTIIASSTVVVPLPAPVATTPPPDTIVSFSQPSSGPTSCPAGKTLICSLGMLKPDGTSTTVCACVTDRKATSTQSNFGQQVKALAVNLGKGNRGDGVSILQLFLISQDKGPAAKSLAKVGATSYFGPLTKAALVEFQVDAKITPALGNFGPKTREYVGKY